MSNGVDLRELIEASALRMWSELNEQLVPHPGELGTARETVLRQFLARYLPQRVGVSTGFVVDSHGAVSRQIDIIIYDRHYSPVFAAAGDTEFFPCESVLAVGQVKSNIGSRAELEGALENLKSVKVLDRSAGGRNTRLSTGEPIDQDTCHLDQIFTFVFGVRTGLSAETIRDVLAGWISPDDRHLWPNVIFSFEGPLVTYACHHGVCPNPMDALAIGVLSNHPRETLLLEFFTLIAMAVQTTNVSSFSYFNHLRRGPFPEADVYFFEDVPDNQIRELESKWSGKPG